MKWSWLSILFFLGLMACKSVGTSEYVQELRALRGQIEERLEVIDNVAGDQVLQLLEVRNQVRAQLIDLSSDTLELYLVRQIDEFKCLSSVDTLELKSVKNAYEEALKSILVLEEDILNNAGRREKYDGYLNDEKERFKLLELRIHQVAVLGDGVLDRCLSLSDSIMDGLSVYNEE